MKTYSIVIPHKNTPELLQRLLDSIPQRKDLEIIIVDDNSDPQIVNFEQFPGCTRDDVRLVFTKNGKGAGYARNVGMKHAHGKWLIFADADDFFSEKFSSVLNKAIDYTEDIVFFKHKSVLSDDISKPVSRCDEMNSFVDSYLNNKNNYTAEMQLRCLWCIPVTKLIRKELVDRHHIQFSEVRYANDIFFSIQTGIQATSIRAIADEAYIITARDKSLTSNFCGTPEEFRIRLSESLKTDNYIKKANVSNGGRRGATDLLWHVYYDWGERYMWHCCFANCIYPKVFSIVLMFLLKRRLKK